MNTKNRNHDLVEKIKHTLNSISEEDKIDIEASVLMLYFMAEIENIQKVKGIDRKTLANMIGTSPSYLTQIFSGNKPLNFKTLAKIQKALNIRFEVKTVDLSLFDVENDERFKHTNTKLNQEEKDRMSVENEFDEKEWTW